MEKYDFLGVHLTRMIGGYITVGPNAAIGFSREGYDKASFKIENVIDIALYHGFWKLILKHKKHVAQELFASINKSAYLRACQKYCP